MKTNLSSQIKLDRIPRRYYDPQGEIEFTALTREEKVYTRIFETVNEGSRYIAESIVRYINRYVAEKGKCVLALGAGNGTHSVYAELIKLYKEGNVSFENARLMSDAGANIFVAGTSSIFKTGQSIEDNTKMLRASVE